MWKPLANLAPKEGLSSHPEAEMGIPDWGHSSRFWVNRRRVWEMAFEDQMTGWSPSAADGSFGTIDEKKAQSGNLGCFPALPHTGPTLPTLGKHLSSESWCSYDKLTPAVQSYKLKIIKSGSSSYCFCSENSGART